MFAVPLDGDDGSTAMSGSEAFQLVAAGAYLLPALGCILPGTYYDAIPGAPAGRECDLSLLPPL
jgi:hypothetical protein